MTEKKEKTDLLTQAEVLNIDHWLKTREQFIQKVSSKMKVGKDFHIIKGRRSLAKGGSEKIASIWHWAAKFKKDDETWEMLGRPVGIVCYVCELYERETNKYVDQGRGARDVQKENGDVNKAIKMAQKSAYVDAVLRASGLSDIFTQDLEDMPREEIETQPQTKATKALVGEASQAQLNYIKGLIKQKNISKLEDIGIVRPAELTKQWAAETIEKLLAWNFLPPAEKSEPPLTPDQLNEIK